MPTRSHNKGVGVASINISGLIHSGWYSSKAAFHNKPQLRNNHNIDRGGTCEWYDVVDLRGLRFQCISTIPDLYCKKKKTSPSIPLFQWLYQPMLRCATISIHTTLDGRSRYTHFECVWISSLYLNMCCFNPTTLVNFLVAHTENRCCSGRIGVATMLIQKCILPERGFSCRREVGG